MKNYKRIVFVTESGTSRAPMAASILAEYTLKNPVEILSRGFVVLFPEPLNQKAEAVMISNGTNLEGYMSSQLDEADMDDDTLILTMEEQLRQKILDGFANANPQNVQVLTTLVGDELEIIDPYGGTLQAYGLCYETLNKSLRKLVKLLNEDSE